MIRTALPNPAKHPPIATPRRAVVRKTTERRGGNVFRCRMALACRTRAGCSRHQRRRAGRIGSRNLFSFGFSSCPFVVLRAASWIFFVLRAPSWIERRRFLPLVRNASQNTIGFEAGRGRNPGPAGGCRRGGAATDGAGFSARHSGNGLAAGSGGDPMIFRVDGSEVALRRGTARCLILRHSAQAGEEEDDV